MTAMARTIGTAAAIAALLYGPLLLGGCPDATTGVAGPAADVGADSDGTTETQSGFDCDIDTHAHLDPIYQSDGQWQSDYLAAAQSALATMDAAGVQRSLLMPPPFSPEKAASPVWYDYTAFGDVLKQFPTRFAFLGGGATLNPMIHAADSDAVTDELRQEFRDTALAIVAAGAAGFGEMAALHLSFFEDHPFMEVQPDHALFLLLADIAAENGLPIDLHMEAVTADGTELNPAFVDPNPRTVDENISAFERLLAHNRQARIVWVHIGWDNTGDMTVDLLRRLLGDHENLYLGVKVLDSAGVQAAENRPVDVAGTIRPEWADLIRDYDDRFVLGADEFYGIAGVTPERPQSTAATWAFLSQLSGDLARKLACDNPGRIYRLD